jgi:methyl-accepting chemotaxis protein
MSTQWSIRTRIVVSVAILVGIAASIAGMGIYEKNTLEAHIIQLTGEQRERDALADRWDRGIVINSGRWTAIALAGSPELYEHMKPLLAATTADVTEVQKRFKEVERDPAAAKLVEQLGVHRVAWHEVRAKIQAAVEAGDFATAKTLGEGPFKDVTAKYLAASQTFTDFQDTRSKALATQVDAEIRRSGYIFMGLMALALVVSVVVALWLTRAILAPVSVAAKAMQAVAQGDLSERIDQSAPAEFAGLMRDLQTMQNSLQRVVGDVVHTADSIRVASGEVAVGNQDLSSRTEQTASNLQETAASMAQLSQTVNQNADAARTASQLASAASADAVRGGGVMGQVIETMEGISGASRKISEIIGVIDGIAFQTNILALNASVEAARAGEQGRGFAVVASEVRNLAQRSAEAAKEIKTLIGASAEKVETGSQLVEQAGATMSEIVASVQRVTDMIGEITASTTEQASGITQVNQAVGHLDQMTQQNAALVEESAAAAESLKDQAQRLAQAVSVFKLQRA